MAYKATYDKLFKSAEWDEALEEIMMLIGRNLRDENLEQILRLDLSFLSNRLDVLLLSNKRAQFH